LKSSRGDENLNPIGVYIHIPFCEQKCLYCDFNSGPASQALKAQYMDALIKEVYMYRKIFENMKIKTLFIGGGTPSSVSPSLFEPLLKSLNEWIDFKYVEEFTIEANPGTVSKEKLQLYKKYGVNRISFGVQSFNDHLLKRIGRVHSSKEAVESIQFAQDLGFDNINIDLMHNLPDMAPDDLYASIEMAKALNVQHVSLYSLILEEGTPLFEEYVKQGLPLMGEFEERQVFHKALDLLEETGFQRYEISNFAQDHKRCKHNMIYWLEEDYLGLGVSAHGMYQHTRYHNTHSIQDYINLIDQASFPIVEKEVLSIEDQAFESIMLGLRLVEGIHLENYLKRYGINIEEKFCGVIEKQKSLGTLVVENGCLKLTEYGHDISNAVIVEFME
jgi:oxygen-independent coproporphyrinogen-3 oxidase